MENLDLDLYFDEKKEKLSLIAFWNRGTIVKQVQIQEMDVLKTLKRKEEYFEDKKDRVVLKVSIDKELLNQKLNRISN